MPPPASEQGGKEHCFHSLSLSLLPGEGNRGAGAASIHIQLYLEEVEFLPLSTGRTHDFLPPPFSYISYVVLQYSIARGRAVGPEEGGGGGMCLRYCCLYPGLTCERGRLTLFPPPQPAANAAQLLPDPRIFLPYIAEKKTPNRFFFHALSRSCASGIVLKFGVYEHSRSCWRCFGHLLAFSTHPSWQNSLSSFSFSSLLRST